MENSRLSVLVALHSGSFSGIDTYAEQIALAGAAAHHKVTLVGVGEEVRAELQRRLGGPLVRIDATRALHRSGLRSAARQLPMFALGEMCAQLSARLRAQGEWFDVAHLNHPALAPAVRRFAARIVVGAWFYPHSARGRVVETWRHTGASFPRSAGFALKGLSHYWNDRQGYSACDCIVAPTELLATQLRSLGLEAVVCPPPSRPSHWAARPDPSRRSNASRKRRITVICGDLSHPRKNVRTGIHAVGRLAEAGLRLELQLIGRGAGTLSDALQALPATVDVLTPGPLPRDQTLQRVAETDVLLVPSLYEEWGYVATEALLAGTPVVACPVYPFIEILEPPLGECAREINAGAIAEALAQVIIAGADRKEVARLAAEKFGAPAIGHRLTRIWAGDVTAEPKVADMALLSS